MNQRTARAVVRLLLAVWAVVVVSWLGVAALVALSILWPANQVPHVLLGLWLCMIVAQLVRPQQSFRHDDDGLPLRILFAPMAVLGPVVWVARRVRRARTGRQSQPPT